jgi:hypothetical protein
MFPLGDMIAFWAKYQNHPFNPNIMKHIKLIVLIISILTLFESCSSNNRPTKTVRAKAVWTSSIDYADHVNNEIELIEVDTLYKTGDTIRVGEDKWLIIN